MSRSTCLNCYGQKIIIPKTDDSATNGVPITCPTCKGEGTVEQQLPRYPMCEDQPAQIDCRNIACKWHVNATCTNVSPAITLSPQFNMQTMQPVNPLKMTAICWSFDPKTNTDANV